jgi:pimeloyl-ACP methyl ester carboxylesterase
MTYEEHYLTNRHGQRWYYRDYGAGNPGTPVLCLSGITRNSSDFHQLAEHLAAEGRRVIALDYPGRGKSDYEPNWRNYRPLRVLTGIVRFTKALHLDHAIVIGTSLGGLMTMGLAALRPGFIKAAVINDIGPDLSSGGIPRIVAYVGRDHPQVDWAGAVQHLKESFPNVGLGSEADWLEMAKGSFKLADDKSLHIDWDVNIAKTLAGGAKSPIPLWLVFRALRWTPLLVIRGGQSDVLSQATFDHMAEVKPDLHRLVIPGAGHTPTLNEPECRAAIDGLLRPIV